MSKKRQKQFGAISIFFRTLITAFSIFVAIATILGCVKITQNAEQQKITAAEQKYSNQNN